jgi:hypothetical protein
MLEVVHRQMVSWFLICELFWQKKTPTVNRVGIFSTFPFAPVESVNPMVLVSLMVVREEGAPIGVETETDLTLERSSPFLYTTYSRSTQAVSLGQRWARYPRAQFS